MLQRLLVALIIIAIALCGYWALIHWGDDPHPLVVDAGAVILAPPGQPPLAIPHEDMLFVPCPLAPRNIPTIQKREA